MFSCHVTEVPDSPGSDCLRPGQGPGNDHRGGREGTDPQLLQGEWRQKPPETHREGESASVGR